VNAHWAVVTPILLCLEAFGHFKGVFRLVLNQTEFVTMRNISTKSTKSVGAPPTEEPVEKLLQI